MSDINFSCPYCQNPLVVGEEGAGLEIPCPVCSQEITIPHESTEPRSGEGTDTVSPDLPVTEEELDRLAEEILRRTMAGDESGGAKIVKREDGGKDVAFNCPSCRARLVVDIAGAGIEIPCPECAVDLIIPDPVKDVEGYLASALASRLSKMGGKAEAAPESVDTAKVGTGKAVTSRIGSPLEELPTPPGRTRIALKPKVRSKKPVETPAVGALPFILPQGATGEAGLAGITEEMAKAAGSGYVIVPIQTPNGPAAMITQAPKADEGNRKRPRYPRKYSELAAKLRSAVPAGEAGEALGELQKRGPLVSRVLAQHFIEKALEESGEVEKSEPEPDPGVELHGHKGALKSPQRLDLQGKTAPAERASRQVTGQPAGGNLASATPPPPRHKHSRHRHSSAGSGKRKHGLVTAVIIIAGLVAIAVMIFNIRVDADMEMEASRKPLRRVQPPTELGLKGEDVTILHRLEQNTARDVVVKFSSAPTWEDQLPYVRQRERTEPLMREYYQREEYRPMKLQETRLVEARYNRGILLATINGVTDESQNYREVPFLLERTPDGQYLVDWEYVVEYNPQSWEAFRKQRPSEAQIFRVLLTPADYYNFEFADSRVYQSFKIEDRETGFVGLYAFVKRDSEVARKLEEEMRLSLPLPCMVKLQFPPNAQADSVVEITEWVRKGWMALPE